MASTATRAVTTFIDQVADAASEDHAAMTEVFALCSTVLTASERASNLIVDLLHRYEAQDLNTLVESGAITRDAFRALVALIEAGNAVAEAY